MCIVYLLFKEIFQFWYCVNLQVPVFYVMFQLLQTLENEGNLLETENIEII